MSENCGPWIPFADAKDPEEPSQEEAYQVIAEINSSFGATVGLDLGVRTTSIKLFAGNHATFISSASSIVWIEQGPVLLTVCDGPSVVVDQVEPGTIEAFGAGTYPLNDGDTIYVPAGAKYYLTATDADDNPGDAIFTSSAHKPTYLRALCSGGSC